MDLFDSHGADYSEPEPVKPSPLEEAIKAEEHIHEYRTEMMTEDYSIAAIVTRAWKAAEKENKYQREKTIRLISLLLASFLMVSGTVMIGRMVVVLVSCR